MAGFTFADMSSHLGSPAVSDTAYGAELFFGKSSVGDRREELFEHILYGYITHFSWLRISCLKTFCGMT